jgi:hypothetical protein
MYTDPEGKFVVTLSAVLGGIALSAGIGAGLALVGTFIQDWTDDWCPFNGSVSWNHYVGSVVGGAIAGAGIGLASILGVATGSACIAFATKGLGSIMLTMSGATAFAISVVGSFVAGGLGYSARTLISDQEDFNLAHMFIEAGANLISGILSFGGSMINSSIGIKKLKCDIPKGNKTHKIAFLHHVGKDILNSIFMGVIPMKVYVSSLKNKLKEAFC